MADENIFNTIDSKRSHANNLFDNKDISGAISLLNEVLDAINVSEDIAETVALEVKQQIAVFSIYAKDYEKAHNLLISVLEKWKDIYGAYSGAYGVTSGYIGWNLFASEKYEEAIPYLEKNILIVKNDLERIYQLGRSLRLLNRNKEAENVFLMTIAVNNGNEDITDAYAYSSLFKIAFEDAERKFDALTYGGFALYYIEKSNNDPQFHEIKQKYFELNIDVNLINNNDFIELCNTGNIVAIKRVIEFGFDINERFSKSDLADRPILHALDYDTAQLIAEVHGDWWLDLDDRNLTTEMIKNTAVGTCGFEALKFIVENDSSLNTNWDGDDGDYPIHTAIRTGIPEIVNLVIDAGGDLSLASNEGHTPLGIAIESQNIAITKLLLESGAPIHSTEYHFNIEFDDDDIPEITEPYSLTDNNEIISLFNLSKNNKDIYMAANSYKMTDILKNWLQEQGWDEIPEENDQGSMTKFRFSVDGKYGLNCFFSVDEKLQMFTLVATPDFSIREEKRKTIEEFCASKRMSGGIFNIGNNGELFYVNSVCFEGTNFTGRDVSLVLKNMCDYIQSIAEDLVALANE